MLNITKRTLEKWRKEALSFEDDVKDIPEATPTIELCQRILRLTQILLDQELIKNVRR